MLILHRKKKEQKT